MRFWDRNTDPKSPAGHEMRIDRLEKHPATGGAGEWAGVQFSGVTIPGDGSFTDVLFDTDGDAAFFYASPYDNDVYSINLSDHKIYIAESGVYEFKLGWFYHGSGTITSAFAGVVVPEQQNVMEAPLTGTPSGSIKAQGTYIRVQSYPDDEVSFPQPVYLQAWQVSGSDMALDGQLIIQRTSLRPHDGTAEVFPTATYPTGSQLP
jgi:hypothetical protein